MVTEIYLTPRTGRFDVSEVEAFIGTLGHGVRDPVPPGTFMLAAEPELAALFARERAEHPERGFSYAACLLRVSPERILVGQACGDPEREIARRFVAWILSRVPCILTDGDGNDWTARAERSVDALYDD